MLNRFRGTIGSWFVQFDYHRAEALHQSHGLFFVAVGHKHAESIISVVAITPIKENTESATKVKDSWLRCHAYAL